MSSLYHTLDICNSNTLVLYLEEIFMAATTQAVSDELSLQSRLIRTEQQMLLLKRYARKLERAMRRFEKRVNDLEAILNSYSVPFPHDNAGLDSRPEVQKLRLDRKQSGEKENRRLPEQYARLRVTIDALAGVHEYKGSAEGATDITIRPWDMFKPASDPLILSKLRRLKPDSERARSGKHRKNFWGAHIR
jgi:hypothetical protein